ncbi:MAG: amidohydrolase family protein [Pseudomonadota bacterium]
MIIDIHTHIFPPRIRLDRAGAAGPEEEAYRSIYLDPQARMIGARELVATMDEDGVDVAAAFGFPWVNRDTARAHNDYLLEAQARFPHRLLGLACFDPRQAWGPAEAERTLDQGLRGLGELAIYGAGFDAEALARLADLGALCRDRNVPLLLHVNEPIGHQYPGKAPLSLREIYAAVKALQGVDLILAHWGGGLFFYNTLKKEVPEALSRVFYDTAASPFLYRPWIYDLAVRIVGPDKVLFGSDFPLIRPARYFKEMAGAGLRDEWAGAIKGEAARRLLRL